MTIELKEIIYLAIMEAHYGTEGIKDKYGKMALNANADEESAPLFKSYALNAKSRVLDILRPFIGTDSSTDDEIILTMSYPYNFDTTQENSILDAVKRFMIDFILYSWFKVTWPDKASLYLSNSEEDRYNIIHRTDQRTTPIKLPVNPIWI